MQPASLTVQVQVSEDGDTLSMKPPDSIAFPSGSASARLWLATDDDGLTPGTSCGICVLARRGEEFSPTVCVTRATRGG